MTKTAVTATIDFKAEGRNIGDLRVPWSDNSCPLGFHPVPVISLKNGDGPVVLMCAGTHGDEFEGPAALMRLVADLRLDQLQGQVIILPALNFAALKASARVSPLDNVNLNRAFPGDPRGSITEQIAFYVESELLPLADAAVDLHSGGKASVFATCTLATQTKDRALFEKNLELANVFGLPLIWVLTGLNDPRSLNSAAARCGVPAIATELGGGGGVDPDITNATERGLYSIFCHLGMLNGAPTPALNPKRVASKSLDHSLFATGEGIFDRGVNAGQSVKAGQVAGRFHYICEPERGAETLHFKYDGFVLAHSNRGFVQRGDALVLVVQDH
ncbi:succinylglutamate desuccinylase/aspartoacylase family protein [Neptunicoccus cionae]|uniref:Succinylglutamate desuccinylase/aspartoacylase n=1 Tax=Neptunicoccus cionae TaxID=2035344 RepID=A0A916VS52_9RHOB|nr:succinylglutamate desuccinylase/aspartoacylase family protein [Amylibacter cionae]GGA25162.1 succinylglutamate desuccinylase/aspartoacylase [Amylibacter cionae]